ncbi:g782 [Coccomyxa elongata]
MFMFVGQAPGNGFITDSATIKKTGISDPNPFFQRLIAKPYVNQVVMAPHLYGPSITHMTSGYSGQALIDTINLSVGYLNKQGYCYQGKCTTWPIIVGETGSSLQDPGDTQFYTTLQQYLQTGDDKHNAISSVFWWAWNANSVPEPQPEPSRHQPEPSKYQPERVSECLPEVSISNDESQSTGAQFTATTAPSTASAATD